MTQKEVNKSHSIPKDIKPIKWNEPGILLLSMFGIGYAPKAPGTVASFVTILMIFPLHFLKAPVILYIPFLVILTIISTFITDMYQKKYELHDPSWIVIDEFLGMFVTWLFLIDHGLIDYFLAFSLFRLFDIIKVWPASYFDKEVGHGFGTIFDDIISGIFAGIIYLVIKNYI